MKIVLFLLSLSFLAQAGITECGSDREDRNYAHLSWVKAATYETSTPYLNLNAIVCLGVDFKTAKVKRFHYRDTSGVKRAFDFESLKKKDTLMLKRSDFPGIARLATRRVDPLSIKVVSERVINNKRVYILDFKFVRNMGIGFSKTDMRKLVTKAVISPGPRGEIKVYYEKDHKAHLFNTIVLRVGGDLVVKEVSLLEDEVFKYKVRSKGLPRARRN